MLVNGDAFITQAIAAGGEQGFDSLPVLARTVFAVAEAEAYCDKDGIDGLIHRYGLGSLCFFSEAFASIGAAEVASVLSTLAQNGGLDEKLVTRANSLITGRIGYNYESIRTYVEARI